MVEPKLVELFIYFVDFGVDPLANKLMIFFDIIETWDGLYLADSIHKSYARFKLDKIQEQFLSIALLLKNVLVFKPFAQI